MQKDKLESPNKSSPSLVEESERQKANDKLETEYPEALRYVLMLLVGNEAKLKTITKEGGEQVIVTRESDGTKLYMTSEPSEIAMLRDPKAGVEFFAKISPIKVFPEIPLEDEDDYDE